MKTEYSNEPSIVTTDGKWAWAGYWYWLGEGVVAPH
jgi:hypothetical protein